LSALIFSVNAMFKITALILAAAMPVAAFANDLSLSCQGQGSVIGTQTTTVNQFQPGNAGHQTGVATTQTRRPYTGTGTVEIKTGVARMRVPDPMVPALMSGGTEGWYPIEGLNMGDREITGVVHINFLSQPKLRIDRMTGKISLIGGAGDFAGDCSAVDTNAKAKF
jgi:hypothetical protein